MKHLWSLICEKSSIDYETNNLSIFNCLEEIRIMLDKTKITQSNKIMIPIFFQILSLWELSGEKNLDLKIEAIDPGGNVINTLDANFPINGSYKRFRSRLNIQGFPANKNGKYIIKVSRKIEDNKYKNEAEIPLNINIEYKDSNSK